MWGETGERALDFEHLTTVMRRLALEAGDAIMAIYGSEDFGVKSKSDASPVTAADEAEAWKSYTSNGRRMIMHSSGRTRNCRSL